MLLEQITQELDLALGCRGGFPEEEGGARIKGDQWGEGKASLAEGKRIREGLWWERGKVTKQPRQIIELLN